MPQTVTHRESHHLVKIAQHGSITSRNAALSQFVQIKDPNKYKAGTLLEHPNHHRIHSNIGISSGGNSRNSICRADLVKQLNASRERVTSLLTTQGTSLKQALFKTINLK